jgi:hypothetical protein
MFLSGFSVNPINQTIKKVNKYRQSFAYRGCRANVDGKPAVHADEHFKMAKIYIPCYLIGDQPGGAA